ncbi:MAG: hypothetical protein ABI353_10570 [Isosphaeraceae bacterium]
MSQQRWTFGHWDGSVQTVPAEQAGPILCLGCQGALEMHQPDLDRPESLLGTCAGCGAWHIVAVSTSGQEIIAVNIPGASQTSNPARPVKARTSARH